MEDVCILALPYNEKPSILRCKGNKLPLRLTQHGRTVRAERGIAGHSG